MLCCISKIKNLFFLIPILTCGYFNNYAQDVLKPTEPKADVIGVKQGLSQGMINCIYQDKEGYMWIGTKDGLNRYDGYQITTYRNNPNDTYSLPDNYCTAIVEDNNGYFWIGTNSKGLFLFDKQTERFYEVPEVNSKKENHLITELKYAQGKLFIKTWNDLLVLDISKVKINNNSKAISNTKILLSYNQIQLNKKHKMITNDKAFYSWCLMQDLSLWVSIKDGFYQIIPNHDFTNWKIKANTPASFGFEIFTPGLVSIFPLVNEPEKLLFAYNNTILHYDTNTRKITYKTSLLPNAKFTSIKKFSQANDGSICGFSDTLAIIYKPKTREIENVSTKNFPLSYGATISLFIDANGQQWFGSNGYGIILRDPRKLLFKSFKGAHPKEVFRILSPAEMPPISHENKIPAEFNCITLDKKGIYWAFVNKNIDNPNSFLQTINPKTGGTSIKRGYGEKIIFANIYNDPKDRLWIYFLNNKNYIAKIDKTTGNLQETYAIPDSFVTSEPYVSQFLLDENGILWLATPNGLYAFNESNKTWKHWKNIPGNSKSLSANGLLSICPDPSAPHQYLWIGTESAGINRFEKKTGSSIRFTEKDGLPNNVVNSILSDSAGNLWISTNNGLSCFNPKNKSFRNFTDEDGLPGNEFNRITGMKLLNGAMMFGGVDGFVVFNPKEILEKQPAAPIVFTGASILNKSINWKTHNGNLDAPIGYSKTLSLKPGQNIFNISFATLEFRNNVKKMYSYKMEGFDQTWTSPSSKNEVTYTNLSPGSYTFYVKGANTDGVWNVKPISMTIQVLPYWYQTALFKIMLLLLFGAALYAFYRYRLMQGLKLEKLRNRIARDLHDEIGSTLSSISIYAEAAKKVTEGNQKAQNILSKIDSGTTEMMEAMSDIVWAVNAERGNLNDLANRMRSFAVQVAEAKDLKLKFTDDENIPHIVLNMEQRKNIYLIYKEAISNAIKYSGCTLLEVRIFKKERNLVIQIKDNGKGFEYENIETIIHENKFGGNGIKNMKVRAKEIGAELQIITKPDNGTEILLNIPLKKS